MTVKKRVIYGKTQNKIDNITYVDADTFTGHTFHFKNTEIVLNERKRLEKEFLFEKSFPSLFRYENTSLWWFFYETFFYKSKEILNFITLFIEFIEKTNPDVIKIENDYEHFDLLKQICAQKNITLEYSKTDKFKFDLYSSIKDFIRKYIRQFKLKRRLSKRIDLHRKLFFLKQHLMPDIQNKVIFASPETYRRLIYNLDTETSETGEYLIQPIINFIDDEFNISCISISHSIKGITDTVLNERLNSDLEWYPEEVFLLNHNKYNEHKEFLSKYRKLISKKEFHDLFVFNNISYWNQVKNIFYQMNYAQYFPYWLDLLDSLSKHFESTKPQAIFLTSEIDAPQLAIIEASKKCKIPTIAIQQGIISDQGPPGYLHDKFTPSKFYDYPFPDKILVFGDFYKKVLIRNGYPKDIIIEFGNPTYFDLEKIEETLSSKCLFEKYNVDKNKKIILFTTSKWQEDYGYIENNYDTQVWRNLIKNFKNKKDFFIILKPHPLENIKTYEKILKDESISNAKIIQGNLIELFHISSVVVSNFSTVIMDAIVFKKFVIEIKWNDLDDSYLRFDDMGVVLPSTIDQLTTNIMNIINNEEIKNEIRKNRAKFLKDHFNLPYDKNNLKKVLKNIIRA